MGCCSWNCPHISIAMDGTDDDMMWNGSEEDGNARSECEEDEGSYTTQRKCMRVDVQR